MKYSIFIVVITILVSGCVSTSPPLNNKFSPVPEPPQKSSNKVANQRDPASQYCIDQGYKLKPIISNHITTGYLCINEKRKKKCEAWAFFRKECLL